MPNSLLLAAARSGRMREVIEQSRTARPVVERFVAGRDRDEALRSARSLLDAGLLVSLDHLGEDATTTSQARVMTASYVDLLGVLCRESFGTRAEVSVKLTAIGLALVDGRQVALDNARTICAAAARAGTTVTFDAEDHTTTDAGLSIVHELRVDFPWAGAVVQAYLHRAEDDCRSLSTVGSRVRLCKGAYHEGDSIAFRRRRDVDASYRRCVDVLMSGAGYPMAATHDPRMIDHALDAAIRVGRHTDSYELQMLYGIRAGEQKRLAEAGARVRTYLAYGDDWYGYFMRRLAERPANLRFFLRSFVPGQ